MGGAARAGRASHDPRLVAGAQPRHAAVQAGCVRVERRASPAPATDEAAPPMNPFIEPEFWARLLGIVIIDLSLAGDHALVIALAVRGLPAREQLRGRVWGTMAAVVLRVAGIMLVSVLLRIPLLQLAGGLALLWIAIMLVRPRHGDARAVRQGRSLREAIWIIAVADVTMSVDNVLAVAAAARGDLPLVVFGIALSLR